MGGDCKIFGGFEKFSGGGVEKFSEGGMRNFRGRGLSREGLNFSVEVTFFREGLAIFWGPVEIFWVRLGINRDRGRVDIFFREGLTFFREWLQFFWEGLRFFGEGLRFLRRVEIYIREGLRYFRGGGGG